MSENGSNQSAGSTILADVENGLAVVGTIIEGLIPGGQIAGIAIDDVINLAKSVIAGAPAAVAAFNDLKAAVDGGSAPTPAQITALKAAVDTGDDQIQQDVAQLDQSGAA